MSLDAQRQLPHFASRIVTPLNCGGTVNDISELIAGSEYFQNRSASDDITGKNIDGGTCLFTVAHDAVFLRHPVIIGESESAQRCARLANCASACGAVETQSDARDSVSTE